MKEILALAVLCVPMFSCSPVHAEPEKFQDGITQCSINGARIYQAMQENSTHTHILPEQAGDLILLFTQGQILIGSSSGIKMLDLFAVSQGLEVLKLYPLPEKCTAIVPLSYEEQTAI